MKRKRSIIADIILVICIIVFFLTLSQLISIFNNYKSERIVYDNIRDKVTSSEPEENNGSELVDIYKGVDLELAIDINRETMCWIYIPDTNIDYPIVKADDNKKYLDTMFEGSEGMCGTLFIDHRIADMSANVIVYGHNMKDGSMFHDLRNYENYDWRQRHKSVYISFERYNPKEYKVVAVMEIESTSILYEKILENDNSAIDTIKKMDSRHEVEQGKSIFCLSTCKGTGNRRILVVIQSIE